MKSQIHTAFVLGAGLGTRLRPLTHYRPKPLFPVFGKPLITFALDHLSSLGIDSFVINTHHLAEQFDKLFPLGRYGHCKVDLIHEPVLLETGGGIKNAASLIGSQPFIVYSGDILTDIHLQRLIDEHFDKGNDVTLALRKTGLSSSIAIQDHRIVDIGGCYGKAGEFDFANVSIWNPSIFERIPPKTKISFVPILRDWIGQGGKIGGVILNDNHWFNIGSRTEYLEVHREIFEHGWKPNYLSDDKWPIRVSPHARISSTAHLSGFYAIGHQSEIAPGAMLCDSVIWDHTKIAGRLKNCIVRDSLVVQGDLQNVDP